MKILIIDQRYNPFVFNRSYGGTETCVKTHIRLLSSKNENSVIFVTSNNSEEYPKENVITHRLSQDSIFFSDKKNDNNIRATEIRKCIDLYKPDVIICHDNMYGALSKIICDIPFFAFIHDVAGVSGLLSISYINYYMNIADKAFLVGVSKKSNDMWNSFIQKTKTIENKNNIYLYNYNCVMWNRIEVSDEIYKRQVSSGRLVHQKNHKKTSKICDLDFFYPGIKSDKEQELLFDLTSNSKYNITLHENMKYEYILDFISKSSLYVTSAEESFGLSGFESSSLGVPLLLCHKDKNHSLNEASSKVYQFDSVDECEKFVKEFTPLSKKERQEISDITYEKFNFSNSYENILKLLSNKKDNSNILSFF